MGYYNITECLIPKLSELKILAVLEMCKEDLPSYSHNRTVQYRSVPRWYFECMQFIDNWVVKGLAG